VRAGAEGDREAPASAAAVRCRKAGVRYVRGVRRDDVKSRVHAWVRRRPKQEPYWALRELDLTVGTGEVLGVVGRNGAGKSTLCRLLGRILRPDEGQVEVRGEVAALLTFGTGFDLRLTGIENIDRAGMMLGRTRREMATLRPGIVEFAGVGEFIDRPVKTYSTGMRARLGFAVAAFVRPEVLIVDEALVTGDLEFYERAKTKIRESVREAEIVVVVTHRLEFVEEQCTRAAWIDRGRLAVYGLPADVVRAYRHSLPERPAPPERPKRITEELEPTRTEAGKRAIVEARDLAVRFPLGRGRGGAPRYHEALSGVSFDIREGEILGVIGPNGAGKSTLCRTLAGILRPDRGTVRVHGEVSALLTFGTGFHPDLSGRDNVLRNGMMLGMPKRRVLECLDEIVAFAELERVIDEPVKTYSSGMKARLGFSIAASLEPDVFLIDEAMNAGDAAFYAKASQRLQEMIAHARAVLVVTHGLAFVERVCTRALWIHRGELLLDGQPTEVVARYRHSVHRNVDPAVAAATS